MYELSKQLNARGVKHDSCTRFPNGRRVFYEEEFSALGETHYVTDDGQREKGFVTDLLNEVQPEFDIFILADHYQCYVRLENRYP